MQYIGWAIMVLYCLVHWGVYRLARRLVDPKREMPDIPLPLVIHLLFVIPSAAITFFLLQLISALL